MMRLVYTATEAANATLASDRDIETSLVDGTETPERQKAWLVVVNNSPHLLQVLDEQESVLDVVLPWSKNYTRMPPANARRKVKLHWVSKQSAAANTAQGVWAQLTTVEPIPPAVSISS